MKKNQIFKSIASVLAILAFFAVMPVSAEELAPIEEEGIVFQTNNSDSVAAPMDNKYPTEVWDLATYGRYDIAGSGNGTADLYTLYLFTGVSEANIYINNHHTKTVTVKLRKENWPFSIESFTVSPGTGVIHTVSMNSSTKYYLAFTCPCDVTGYISPKN